MAKRLEELPLFPLNTVLFPYAQIHLHVFEERYREMIQNCIRQELPFGVVLIRDGQEVGGPVEPYMVGTAARIVTVQTHDDGRMDISANGERRFRIRQIEESKPYMVGLVEPIVESSISDSIESDVMVRKARDSAMTYIANYFAGLDVRVARVTLHEDPMILSFMIASLLQIPNLERQHLLETTDTMERLSEMIPILDRLIEENTHSSLTRLRADDVVRGLSNN
jgi:Lon protease-like protein